LIARNVLCCCALILAACAPSPPTARPQDTPIPTIPPDQRARRLVTVEVPPTVDPALAAQTARAALPTSTPPPTITPSVTPYIGVYLGDARVGGDGIPDVNIEQYAGTLAAANPVVFPTLGINPCLIAADPLYGTTWNADASARLGCAGEPVTSYIGAAMFFERGVMYSLPTNELYTIIPGGATTGRYFYAPVAPPAQTWEIVPPPGLLAPTGVFGAEWRAVEAVRTALGFAQTPEQPVTLSLQRFDRGALLFDASAGQVFALIGVTGSVTGDGTVYGPYSSSTR
jgi:hypothetical protein